MNWQSFIAGALFTIVVLGLLAIAFSSIEQQQTANTTATGTINTTLTFQPSHIDWGIVYIRTPATCNVTFTNNGASWQSLNMTCNATTNLLNYTLMWDAEGLSLLSGNSLTANFTLTIIEANVTVTDQFTIDIWISDQTW